MENSTSIGFVLTMLEEALRNRKPNDRSEMDRHFAVAMTEFEKLSAYINTYCLYANEKEE
jgi:hypothetical protein